MRPPRRIGQVLAHPQQQNSGDHRKLPCDHHQCMAQVAPLIQRLHLVRGQMTFLWGKQGICHCCLSSFLLGGPRPVEPRQILAISRRARSHPRFNHKLRSLRQSRGSSKRLACSGALLAENKAAPPKIKQCKHRSVACYGPPDVQPQGHHGPVPDTRRFCAYRESLLATWAFMGTNWSKRSASGRKANPHQLLYNSLHGNH